MSDPPGTLAPVITEDALLTALAGEGVNVCETVLDSDLWGGYSLDAGVVYLQRGMPAGWRAAVLAHELQHVRRGDRGHQDPTVENAIDEVVARMLVNPGEYAFWEGELGWSTGGIASALELPRWVVEAYRRVLARQCVDQCVDQDDLLGFV